MLMPFDKKTAARRDKDGGGSVAYLARSHLWAVAAEHPEKTMRISFVNGWDRVTENPRRQDRRQNLYQRHTKQSVTYSNLNQNRQVQHDSCHDGDGNNPKTIQQQIGTGPLGYVCNLFHDAILAFVVSLFSLLPPTVKNFLRTSENKTGHPTFISWNASSRRMIQSRFRVACPLGDISSESFKSKVRASLCAACIKPG